MWAMGKIFQRLGENDKALNWFSKSHRVNPAQPDVAREAGLTALDTGEFQQAVDFIEAVIRVSPNDPGLVSNLALAQVLAGSIEKAHHSASVAVAAARHDGIVLAVFRVVEKVYLGQANPPKSMSEIQRLL